MLRDFRTFARLIAAHFAAMSVHELFRVDISGDHLWQSYLDAFPPGTNPRRVELQLKLDVVKEVIAYVQAENARKRAEADVAAQRAAIKEALAGRAAKDLENLSTEQLEERLRNLGGA